MSHRSIVTTTDLSSAFKLTNSGSGHNHSFCQARTVVFLYMPFQCMNTFTYTNCQGHAEKREQNRGKPTHARRSVHLHSKTMDIFHDKMKYKLTSFCQTNVIAKNQLKPYLLLEIIFFLAFLPMLFNRHVRSQTGAKPLRLASAHSQPQFRQLHFPMLF